MIYNDYNDIQYYIYNHIQSGRFCEEHLKDMQLYKNVEYLATYQYVKYVQRHLHSKNIVSNGCTFKSYKNCSADDINGELEWCWDQSLMLNWYLNMVDGKLHLHFVVDAKFLDEGFHSLNLDEKMKLHDL